MTNLRIAFNLQSGDVISLVGAGGKTTLMFALTRELLLNGGSVITTTTTKIFGWQASKAPLILDKDEERMINRLREQLKEHRHVTVAREKLAKEGKLEGISPWLIDRLAEMKVTSNIIIEADGAAGKPLKAPNANEPVIPRTSSLIVPVIGFDALGSRLNYEDVFRPEIISWLTGLPWDATISADVIATLITHSHGIIKGSPTGARVIPFINKMDIAQDLSAAEDLAIKILEKMHPQIERVVLGQVNCSKPVFKVFLAGKSGT